MLHLLRRLDAVRDRAACHAAALVPLPVAHVEYPVHPAVVHRGDGGGPDAGQCVEVPCADIRGVVGGKLGDCDGDGGVVGVEAVEGDDEAEGCVWGFLGASLRFVFCCFVALLRTSTAGLWCRDEMRTVRRCAAFLGRHHRVLDLCTFVFVLPFFLFVLLI